MDKTIDMHRRALVLAALASLGGCGGGQGPTSASAGSVAPPLSAAPPVPAGSVEQLSVPSRALGRDMAAAVYLPPGYERAARYRLLYLFYGYGGDENAYFTGLALHRAADHLIASNAIEPLIIVVPDYDNSFGVNTTREQAANSAGGSIGPYEDYLIGELLPWIEARYSMALGARHVGGVSMGGFAALHLALRHPGLFASVGAHSAALWDYSEADQFRGQRNWLYATPALRAERDPFLLAAKADLSRMRFYLDVGASDGLRPQVEALHALLVNRGAASALHVAAGGHDAGYWRGQMENWLRFHA